MRGSRRDRPAPSPRETAEPISTLEVARFLKRLSALYRDRTTGNLPLSDALAGIAAALTRQARLPIRDAISALDTSPRQRGLWEDRDELRDLSLDDVARFLSDETVPKTDLVRLGVERFAISRSRLERISRAEVAEAISSAMRNEESLKIISQEAERGGSRRSS
jgi:hypothetical protein